MATLEDRQRTGATNQALIRDVNERVVQLAPNAANLDEPVDFLCECFDRDCIETMSLTLAEYDEIRASPVRFPVKPGHELLEIERVVETNERYTVVEKFGEGGELAAARHPRG
jgi:protein-disulfide isomerase